MNTSPPMPDEDCQECRGFWIYTWSATIYRGKPPTWCHAVVQFDQTEVTTWHNYPTRELAIKGAQDFIDGYYQGREAADGE